MYQKSERQQSPEYGTLQKPIHTLTQKPIWATDLPDRDAIADLAELRTEYFTAYTFGGGVVRGTEFTDEECAKAIVVLSEAMLNGILSIGRRLIAGEHNAQSPAITREWVTRQKQRFSLYITLDELLDATAGIELSRQQVLDSIPIEESRK